MVSVPVVLDTDVGTDVDDAIAIGLLAAAPEVDLRTVTTVSGDTTLRARIAKKLLVLGGRADVPVAAGVRDPVLRQRNFLWLGHEGKDIVAADEPLSISSLHAVDLLIDTVLRERPHVIAIGPLSNLAVAIMKEPAVISAVSELTIMGGTLRRDATLGLLDYNLESDAEAALVVLNAGIPTTLVPVDTTAKVFLTAHEISRLRRSPSALVQTLCKAIDVWAPLQRALADLQPDAVAYLHDPLTVALLLDPTLVTYEYQRRQPLISGGSFELRAAPDAPNFRVAVDVDAPRFVNLLVDRLLRLE